MFIDFINYQSILFPGDPRRALRVCGSAECGSADDQRGGERDGWGDYRHDEGDGK